MATYETIQAYVKLHYGYVPKSCWIAHVKEIAGLKPRISYNRYSRDKRTNPCPEHKINDLLASFRHFGMIA